MIMRRSAIYWLAVWGIIFIIVGCQGNRKITETVPQPELSESQQREYNYALTEATKQKLFGNFQQAAALYSKCIEVNPSSAVAYFQLSGIYLMNRDVQMAKKMNRTAAILEKENYWYKIQLAQIYLMTESPDSAALIYSDIIERWPEKVEIRYELSRLYSETGKTAKAIEILEEIERENGISEPVSMLKEQIYIKENKPELAIRELNKLIEAAPTDIRFHGILAELYTDLDRKEEAMQAYKRIFEIEPGNGIAQLSMAEFYRLENKADKQFEYLRLAFRNKDLPADRKMRVIIDFLTNEDMYKGHESEIDSLIIILSQEYPHDYRIQTAKADFLAKQEKYEEALELYNDILSQQKGNYFIWEQAIFIENILGNTDNVYDKCSEAMKYFKDRPFLYLFHGNSAMQKDLNQEAIRSLENGLEYVEDNLPLKVQFYAFLAEAWRNLKDYEKSDEYFESALETEPENMMVLNNYGYYLSLRGEKLEKAEQMSKRTIEIEPDNFTYLDTYAWILYKMGKFKEARQYIEKAMEHGGGEDPDILEHYGDILDELGEIEMARKYWRLAKEKGGTSEELQRKLDD